MPDPVSQRFPRQTFAVREARAFVQSTLTAWSHTERTNEVLLCVSELATNAVQHGAPAGGHFLVKVATTAERLRIEVHDMNRQRPRVRHPAEDDINGRGLQLVDTLSDGWGVEPRSPRGKVVWTEFKIETQPEASTSGAASC